jgi:N utilization substance protein B
MSRQDGKREAEAVVARRAALWVLVSMDINGSGPDPLLMDMYTTMTEVDELVIASWPQVEERVQGVWAMWDALNEQVQELSPRWKLDRMATVDRNILRLGAWELLDGYAAPLETINACVELGKEYGEKGTPGFVNGLLDQLCQDHQIPLRRG